MDERSIAVLLIEDDVAAVHWFRQELAGIPSPHFEITTVGGLDSALRCLAENQFDVIALALGLPEEQAFAIFASVRERAAHTPIVILVSVVDDVLGPRTAQWGAHDYLVKGQFDGRFLARVICCAIERQRAAEEVRKREERWWTYVETANDLMFTLDAAGTITWANRATYAATGYQQGELLGRSVLEVIAPESYAAAADALGRVLRQEDVKEAVLEAIARDGRRLTLEIHGRLLYDDARFTGTFHIARDISSRKQAEAALRESESRLRAILDSVQTGVLIVDPETHTIVDVNPAGARLIGASREAIVGALCHKFVCPAEVGRCPITDLGLAVERAERILLTADGAERSIIKTVECIMLDGRSHLLESFIDITDRKEAERQLQRYARRLEILHEIDQAILASRSPEAIAGAVLTKIQTLIPCQRVCVTAVERDSGQAQMLAVLPVEESGPELTHLIAGVACQALPGIEPQVRRVQDLHTAPDVSEAEKRLLLAGIRAYLRVPLLIRGEAIGSLNLCFTVPSALDGESLDIAQEVASLLALAIDHADLHQQIEHRAAELEVRNAELDAFASTVAHDLQNPLGLITGFASLLEEGWTGMAGEEVQNSLETISRAGSRMSRIIHELLMLAEVRHQDVDRVALDMGQIVANAQELLAHLIQECQAEISLPDPSMWPVALGYAPWVEEVWANYLSNAIKYGGRPPRIELGATVQPEDGMIRFWVRDHGPGVSLQDQPRLFTPFPKLTGARDTGHGLGLSIVRHIVQKLDGQVGVESEGLPGRGSVFSFTLPAARPAGRPGEGSGGEESDPP